MTIEDMGVKQIEKAITQLPARELAELVPWLAVVSQRLTHSA